MQIIIFIALLIIVVFSTIKKNGKNKKIGPLSEEEKKSLLEGQERSRIIREAAKRREEMPRSKKLIWNAQIAARHSKKYMHPANIVVQDVVLRKIIVCLNWT